MASVPPPPVTRPGVAPTTERASVPAPIRKAAGEAKWFLLERPERASLLVGLVSLVISRRLALSALSAAATYGGVLYYKEQSR